MDERCEISSAAAERAMSVDFADQAAMEEASAGFVGQWHRLVSTTNWEKGRIIAEWRARLVESGAPAAVYSDEAWSRRVAGVSPQHVGRLRRVYERFAATHAGYAGLYWSHFQAAVEWHDAEMWLEGAVQNDWSVARMRSERWQATGSPADQTPCEDQIVASELDEDFNPADAAKDAIGESVREIHGFDGESSEGEGDAPVEDRGGEAPWEEPGDSAPTAEAAPPVRPFEHLPTLPPDLADALETLKLAILNHKLAGWKEVSLADVLAMLDGLRQLAAAESGE